MQKFDLIVIGGGSAGLKAARTVAKAGKRVAVAEEKALGGECFWAGCVPTKAMIRAAQVWHLVKDAEKFGISVEVKSQDYLKALEYKAAVIRQVSGDGPEDAGLSKLGASYYPTRAHFVSPHEVKIGEETIYGEQILLSTGTVPAIPEIPGLLEAGFITNREAVDLPYLPKRLVVLGSGPIGVEFAQTFRRFGSEVTLVEKNPHALFREDSQIAAIATECLESEGIRVIANARTVRVSVENGEKIIHVLHKLHSPDTGEFTEETLLLPCDTILVSIGRNAAVESLNLPAAGLEHFGKRLKVDPYLRTDVPHIWAAGDISSKFLFTHVASYEGRIVSNNLLGKRLIPVDYRVIPRCTYIDPEIASIGLTEKETQATGNPYDLYEFPFAELDRAVLHGDSRGIVKLIADARDGQILGAHIIGHEASSLLGEVALCMQNRLPVSAISSTMHAYPSFPEAVEAAVLYGPD